MRCSAMLMAVALWAGSALAGEAREAEDCAAIGDDAARLACYDRRANPPPAAGELGKETATASGAAGPGAGREPPRAGELIGRLFRFGRRPSEAKPPVSAGEIVRIQQLVRGNTQITLDNGDVWRENEREPRTSYELGDRIVVRAGVLGTYNLDNERSGQRVKAQPVR